MRSSHSRYKGQGKRTLEGLERQLKTVQADYQRVLATLKQKTGLIQDQKQKIQQLAEEAKSPTPQRNGAAKGEGKSEQKLKDLEAQL